MFVCACVAWVLVSRLPCGGFKVLVWSCSVPPEPPFPGPPFPRTALPLEGLQTTVRELQTCTFERPGASNTKIPREDPQRGKKRTNFAAGQGKKARNFGPSTLRGPTFSGLGPPPFEPPPFEPPPFEPPPFEPPPTPTQNTQKKT